MYRLLQGGGAFKCLLGNVDAPGFRNTVGQHLPIYGVNYQPVVLLNR